MTATATFKISENAAAGGRILTDGDGWTVYTFDATTTDPSKCTGACLTAWPAVSSAQAPTAPSGLSGALDLLTRPDNIKQVTYNKMPLYYFSADTAPGQANGIGKTGFGGNWQAVKAG